MSIEWNAPVRIRIGTGSPDTIKGPNNAFEALNNRWPAERGPHYRDAKLTCSMAAAGEISAEIAREKFISAALEAHVLA
jgi:hypothetical protein